MEALRERFQEAVVSSPKPEASICQKRDSKCPRFLRFAGRGCEPVVACLMTVEKEGRSQRTHFGSTLGTYRNTLSEDARNIGKETQ